MGKEYVEREAILKDLELLAKYQHGERQQGILGVCETIKRRPAADVVEVCRGIDCRCWQANNGGYPHKECRWGKDETPDADDFAVTENGGLNDG